MVSVTSVLEHTWASTTKINIDNLKQKQVNQHYTLMITQKGFNQLLFSIVVHANIALCVRLSKCITNNIRKEKKTKKINKYIIGSYK